jgi:hypothetical protein
MDMSMNKTHDLSFNKCLTFLKNKLHSCKNILCNLKNKTSCEKEICNKETITDIYSSTSIQINVVTPKINNSSIYMSSTITMSNTTNGTTDNTTDNTKQVATLSYPDVYTYFSDYSKYNYSIVSSLVDTMIDIVEIKDYLNDKDKIKKEKTIFYNKQHDILQLHSTFNTEVFKEFEEIVTNILTPSSVYLLKLCEIKTYSGDLQNIYTRYGVFETNNFIIKIDNHPDTITAELSIMYAIGKGVIYPYNIVLPYYIHNAGNYETKYRDSYMNFSIQPRIKNTISLHRWIKKIENRFYDITYYIKLCITISKSILFIHSHGLVHGDIKPDNILIELSSNIPYIIDFGLTGIHSVSHGTGGTRPFCCPETGNTTSRDNGDYIWCKNKKKYDMWSIAFIFSTIIIFKSSYHYYSDYPKGYFGRDKYVNPQFLKRIHPLFREPFMLILCKKSDINLSNFILLLEEAILQYQSPDVVTKIPTDHSSHRVNCQHVADAGSGSTIMCM